MKERLLTWIDSDDILTIEMFNEFKPYVRRLKPNEQITFFKKVVGEIANGQINLSLDNLKELKVFSIDEFVEFGEPQDIDYSIDLILHTLSLVENTSKFPENTKEVYGLVKSIADFVCEYLNNKLEYLTKIDLLFDSCPGRTAIVRKEPNEKFIRLRGKDYKAYEIYTGYSIRNRRKDGWGDLVVHHRQGIYAKGQKCFVEVLETREQKHGDDIVKYGSNIVYGEKKYPFTWERDGNAYLITPEESPVKSCEGRKSEKACELSNREFWWCYGRKCFEANQSFHSAKEWKLYSLKDFLKVLQLPYNDSGYYIFVSEINRLNRILDRLKCKECDNILRPSKQTNFGFYRVSHFHCTNEKCSSFGNEIYLTHCLNSKCTNVIDSRVAKRCSNGFIICDKCGSCCSNDQFNRRIESLRANGQNIPNNLVEMVANKMGHLEKSECFCYKCQKEMTEVKGGGFTCNDCKVTYNGYNLYIKFHSSFKTNRQRKRKTEEQNNEYPI